MTDIRKVEKKIISALVFLIMKIGKNIESMYDKTLLRDMLIYY